MAVVSRGSIMLKQFAKIHSSFKACFNTTPNCYGYKNELRRKPLRVVDSFDTKKSVKKLEVLPFGSIITEKNAFLPRSKDAYYVPLPRYEKLKENDERFTKTLTILKSSKLREASGKILLEGVRLINDAIDAGVQLQTLYFSNEEMLSRIKLKMPNEAQLFKVLYKTMKIWSSLKTCPGVMGVFKKPSTDDLCIMNDPTLPVTVICHNIKDCKVIGSVVRIAAAAGCRCVLFTKDCTDVWKQRVLHIGCGGHFRIPIVGDIEWPHIINYLSENSTVYLVDNCMNDETEVFVDYDEELLSNKEIQLADDESYKYVDENYNDSELLKKYENNILTKLCYFDVTYPQKDIVLCVSEHDSINDPRAIKLACDFGGYKLKIPTENKTAISTQTAFSVILYEIRRQCTETYVFH